jgi:hypothetical protein
MENRDAIAMPSGNDSNKTGNIFQTMFWRTDLFLNISPTTKDTLLKKLYVNQACDNEGRYFTQKLQKLEIDWSEKTGFRCKLEDVTIYDIEKIEKLVPTEEEHNNTYVEIEITTKEKPLNVIMNFKHKHICSRVLSKQIKSKIVEQVKHNRLNNKFK